MIKLRDKFLDFADYLIAVASFAFVIYALIDDDISCSQPCDEERKKLVPEILKLSERNFRRNNAYMQIKRSIRLE